jgi:hypothetical protein
MASGSVDVRTVATALVIVALLVFVVYLLDPSLGGLLRKRFEGFDASGAMIAPPVLGAAANDSQAPMQNQPAGADTAANVAANPNSAGGDKKKGDAAVAAFVSGGHSEGFADLEDTTGPAEFGSPSAPAGCYPRDQLTPSELLPRDTNSTWAQQNPMGTGSLKGKNFLSAGALIGVNTVGQSLRNANLQLRSEPPNPQVSVSVFNQSTIEPDLNRRDMEIN